MRGLTPKCVAYCALATLTKGANTRALLSEYEPRALDQGEEAMRALVEDMTGVERIAIYPSYTEVNVTVLAGNAEGISFRGMVRDGLGIPRRITNLDTGTEFFTDPDVPLDVVVTKVPENRAIGQYAG